MSEYILGISAHYHDSAACLLRDGQVIAASQEERFTRKKHDEAFPIQSIKYCLQQANIHINKVNAVAYYEKPILKFDRLLKTYLSTWPMGFRSFRLAMITWLGSKLWIENEIRQELGTLYPQYQSPKKTWLQKLFPAIKSQSELWEKDIYFIPHHLSHAASSYYASGFENATTLTIDGVGEWATTTIGKGQGSELKLKKEIHFPHSLGLLYSAFTYYLGFKVNSAEYKVMGLAPYGQPKYTKKIYQILKIYDDGSFALKQKIFTYRHTLRMTGQKFAQHFDHPTRQGENEPLSQFHKDLAASLQRVTEELVLRLVKHAYQIAPAQNLCLAGGVALNCVANGRVVREGPFKNIYIFPASGDAGGAFGAAAYLHTRLTNQTQPLSPLNKRGQGGLDPKQKTKYFSPYLGPEFDDQAIEDCLKEHQIPYTKLTDQNRAPTIARSLAKNQVVGHFAGRMEFGPRALGNRSILADPRNKENWQRVNLMIKFRESFRPFAPSVLAEKANDLFELESVESPYMLLTTQTWKTNIPAVTHLDNSARVQTVTKEQNPLYHELISAFDEITDCPCVINTSFNIRGEPIVCHPLDALKGFVRTEMDVLVLGNFWITADQVDKAKLRQTMNLETFAAD